MPKGRNHLITLPRVVVIQSKRLLTGAHFLFKFDLVFHSSFGPEWFVFFGGIEGTDRLWQLIKKVVPHSFFIAVVYRAA